MITRINQDAKSDNRWPCVFCDEWFFDVLS